MRAAWFVGVLVLLNTPAAQAVPTTCDIGLITNATLDSNLNCPSSARISSSAKSRNIIAAVLADINAMRKKKGISASIRKKLKLAEKRLKLAKKHLNKDKGTKGIKEINKTVTALLQAEKKGARVGSQINQLVKYSRTLAQEALDAAVAGGGKQKLINDARALMTKAKKQGDKDKPDKAINIYKAAWGKARKAGVDITPPVITLIGANPLVVDLHTTFVDPRSTVSDAVSTGLTATVTGTVDVNTVGAYILSYDVTDEAGNVATTVTRTVNVEGAAPTFGASTTPPLNDTGFTWGGNVPSGNNSTCIGETISQQDCSHGRDALNASGNLVKIGAGRAGFDFSKLDALGDDLPVNAPLWSCVRDNHTSLYWEIKTDDGGIRDKNNSYRWGGKTSQLTSSFGTLYDDWDSLVDEANSSALCGFTDWRVPSRVELSTLVDYSGRSNALGGARGPNIDTDYFPNTGSIYWSSSPRVDWNDAAWSVTFGNGAYADQTGRREYPRLVRLVRSNM
jgi:hypothetical protein